MNKNITFLGFVPLNIATVDENGEILDEQPFNAYEGYKTEVADLIDEDENQTTIVFADGTVAPFVPSDKVQYSDEAHERVRQMAFATIGEREPEGFDASLPPLNVLRGETVSGREETLEEYIARETAELTQLQQPEQ